MNTQIYEIEKFLRSSEFQIAQNDIALATDLAIITVDYTGKPITNHSKRTEFCTIVRSSQYGVRCEYCDSHAGLEAARLKKPFVYTCHAGLIDFAIPIISNNIYVGAFMAGQVLLSSEDSDIKPENIFRDTNEDIQLHKLKEAYTLLPIMRLEKINNLANMLLHLSNYSIKAAKYSAMLSQNTNRSYPISRQSSTDNNQIHNGINKLSTTNQLLKDKQINIIEPALLYIKENPGENITVKKLASLCNISTSYFSKLFAKENLGTLPSYVNEVRIDYAKELLNTTNLTIQAISENVGFNDSGYFIKSFKKITHQTPLEYRKSSI